jgi:hypothetical protein
MVAGVHAVGGAGQPARHQPADEQADQVGNQQPDAGAHGHGRGGRRVALDGVDQSGADREAQRVQRDADSDGDHRPGEERTPTRTRPKRWRRFGLGHHRIVHRCAIPIDIGAVVHRRLLTSTRRGRRPWPADGVLDLAGRLVGLAFSLHLGVAGDLADSVLHGALGLLGRACNAIFVHVPDSFGPQPKWLASAAS